jgi:hypothetical protein
MWGASDTSVTEAESGMAGLVIDRSQDYPIHSIWGFRFTINPKYNRDEMILHCHQFDNYQEHSIRVTFQSVSFTLTSSHHISNPTGIGNEKMV